MLSSHCEHYTIADFDDDDINRLTVLWHKEVVGNRQDIIAEAENLAITICDSDRVKRLAQNPLLLTTLLLVKRWVRELPTRRSVLYGKAIEVLLMTWNVEGHKSIDQEEAIPQLAFVAYYMMKEGIQRISYKQLNDQLHIARQQMPEILGFTTLSVSEFIGGIELRSSLLMLTGHDIENGTLQPMYEFRHLTFQEYLAARAIVDQYYPDSNSDNSLLSLFTPYIYNENWKEVIPLSAVLAGKKVQPLISHLIELCASLPSESLKDYKIYAPQFLLMQCLIDEVQITPEVLESALLKLCRLSLIPDQIYQLQHCKYGPVFKNKISELFTTSKSDLTYIGSILNTMSSNELGLSFREPCTTEIVNKIIDMIKEKDPLIQSKGALLIMEYAWSSIGIAHLKANDTNYEMLINNLTEELYKLLNAREHFVRFSASWAFAWLIERNLWQPPSIQKFINALLKLWLSTDIIDLQFVASWAFTALPLTDRDTISIDNISSNISEILKKNIDLDIYDWRNRTITFASLIGAYYLRLSWSDEETRDTFIRKISL